MVLALAADRTTPGAIIPDFPTRTEAAVRAVVACAAVSAEENMPLPGVPASREDR
jgi:hypothetical protein